MMDPPRDATIVVLVVEDARLWLLTLHSMTPLHTVAGLMPVGLVPVLYISDGVGDDDGNESYGVYTHGIQHVLSCT